MEENNKLKPWQFNTTGLVLGFLLGFLPFFIALVGNHQFKQNKDVQDLKKAYNIILVLSFVLIILAIIFMIVVPFSLFLNSLEAKGNIYY